MRTCLPPQRGRQARTGRQEKYTYNNASKEDQRRIMDYLDRLQSRVDELRKHQTETQEQIDVLSQSILVKAFRGELLDLQDPSFLLNKRD